MPLIQQNYTEQAKEATAHDILHRDAVLARLLRITSRQYRNNLLLLGEPGVGKTALMQGLAFRLAHYSDLSSLRRPILAIQTTSLALLLREGQTQELDEAIAELKRVPNAIVVIDDARSLLSNADLISLLYVLQPLFEHPTISVCLICSTSEYRRYLENDPIFSRECEPVTVPELTEDQAKDIVLSLSPSRHRKSGFKIQASTITQLVGLAKRYVVERALPAKAVSLLDEAIAKAKQEHKETVTIDDVKLIIAEKTGIPVDTLTASEQERLLNLEQELDAQVIGQPHVTKAVSQVIRRSRAGLKDPKRPIASFMFLGSSGVGKTELAKVLSTSVFHNERALIRFDMSEFSESHTAQRLVGAPPGYIGFEEGGQLTNAVLAQPYSLILLDELEKAHPKIFDIFLQVMDDGRLTDGKGRTVDFSNTVIIATSNLVVDDILKSFSHGEDTNSKEWYEQHALPLLSSYFRPEFINRFDDVLVFTPFSKGDIWKIAQLEVQKLQKRLEGLHIALSLDESQLKRAIEALYNPQFGARPVRRYLQEHIENSLAEDILRGKRNNSV